MDVGTNLKQEEDFSLEDVGFQLQQWEVIPPFRHFDTITNFPIPRWHLCVPSNPNAHPNTRFSKVVHCNIVAQLAEHRNKWEMITYGRVLCGESDYHPILMIRLHNYYTFQGGEGLRLVS